MAESDLTSRIRSLESTVRALCSCVSCLHSAMEDHVLYAQKRCGACAVHCLELLHSSATI